VSLRDKGLARASASGWSRPGQVAQHIASRHQQTAGSNLGAYGRSAYGSSTYTAGTATYGAGQYGIGRYGPHHVTTPVARYGHGYYARDARYE